MKQKVVLVETGQEFESLEKCSECLQIPAKEIADAITTGNAVNDVHFKIVDSRFEVGDYVERRATKEDRENGSNIYQRLGVVIERVSESLRNCPAIIRVFNPFLGQSFEILEDELEPSVGEFAQETKMMQSFPPKWKPRFEKGDAVLVKAIVTDVEYGRFGYKIVTDSISPETFVHDGGDKTVRPYHKSV